MGLKRGGIKKWRCARRCRNLTFKKELGVGGGVETRSGFEEVQTELPKTLRASPQDGNLVGGENSDRKRRVLR